MSRQLERQFNEILAPADVRINGDRPWDIQVNNPNIYKRVLQDGNLGAGEGYMAGEWDCEDLSGLIARVTHARVKNQFSGNVLHLAVLAKEAILQRLESTFDRDAPAKKLAGQQYNLGNDFFATFLGESMVYSCAFWEDAETLEDAQVRKLDFVCRKLRLQPGMRVLDIGGGWGSFAIYAAQNYGAHVVNTTISAEQVQFAEERRKQLPSSVAERIENRLQDYRDISPDGPYDRIASIGMFEHVRRKNYPEFFRIVCDLLTDDGIFLLHTIVSPKETNTTEEWATKYIFPGSETSKFNDELRYPSHGILEMRYAHNYGRDYDRTCMEWFRRFDEHWEELKPRFEPNADRFYRMWRLYLLGSAGSFRARGLELWQILYTKWGSSVRVSSFDYEHPDDLSPASFYINPLY